MAIGVLMVLIIEVRTSHRLVRPFLGVGVLGGFTTFSSYTVQTQELVTAGRVLLALGYLFGTLAAAVLTVQMGVVLARVIARRHLRGAGCQRHTAAGRLSRLDGISAGRIGGPPDPVLALP